MSSSKKPVTKGQGNYLVKIANEKGVGRAEFQKALDDPTSFARFLDSLKVDEKSEYVPLSDARIDELTQKAATVGARIHVLRRVRIQQDRNWQEAAKLAGPDIPSDHSVLKGEVGKQYQSASKKVVEKDIVLLNYSNGDGNWDKAITWGKEASLKSMNPREAFAIGEQHPTLHITLGQNPMDVVAPTECSFGGRPRACSVWWDDSERGAGLLRVSHLNDTYNWFGFCE